MAMAALAMGGWAAFANRFHPMPSPLQAGLIQAILSAAMTLLLKRSIEALAGRLSGLTALLAPPPIAALASAGLLTTVHAIGGTPEIARTIAVPLTVSTSYAALYTYALWRNREV